MSKSPDSSHRQILQSSSIIGLASVVQIVWHLFVVRTDKREELQQHLSDNDVQTLIHYPLPPHKQMAYGEWSCLSYPITESIHRSVLSLPIGPTLSVSESEIVSSSCSSWALAKGGRDLT